MVNLSAFIAFHAARQPDYPAIIYRDEPISYAQFEQRIRRLAALMARHRIGEDDVVALVMKNSPAFLDVVFAASYLGAVFLPVNYRLGPGEAQYILRDAGARLLLVDEEFESLHDLIDDVVVVDQQAQADSRSLSDPQWPTPDCRMRHPRDLFRLMYTSGTTGRPKGVMHSYENFYWKSNDLIISVGLSKTDRLLTVGPLYHVGAFDLPGVTLLWLGGTLCVHRDFDAESTLSSIARHQLTCGWAAPSMLNRMLDVDGTERFDLGSFQWCIGGGEKTPESRIRDFTRLFPNGRYVDAYGLTETCGGDTYMEAGREIEKIGSTGPALAHLEIRICDESGGNLPAGTNGEICLRGPKVTSGYWNAPEKTAGSFFDEWFRTGDVGYLDTDGFLYITDRRKDMILTGGENVASAEVENVIYQLPQVAEAAVVGLPSDQWGEQIVAVVVLRSGQQLGYEELRQHCRAHLAAFKTPKQLLLRAELPRNPSGKVLKRILRDEYSAG